MHQDSGYDTMEHPVQSMAPPRSSIDEDLPRKSTFLGFAAGHSDNVEPHSVPALER